ncbi:hypothetical protein FNU76_10185 [Chitinimonas arctica]|uniref:Uncharacterized protein n=1 Tax=Chitinimonas arctica TaxID=2594795 RepID=A0A516SEY7_9NEIS|nr:hypothetical protein [Chitinimonas arctica]QDQ26702.1 hypothetical protein FNU76_10185 [Chitinimonas arctica]
MQWQLDWGAYLPTLLEEEAESGETPQALLDMPPLDPDNARWYQAFNDLNPSRVAGFGPGSIPVSEILAYAQLLQVDDRDTLFRRIRACDHTWLQHAADQQKTDT